MARPMELRKAELSTYLGHASVRGTYWYLQTTPQLLSDVAGAAEAWMNGEPR
jgi:integrase/recombinase XerD